MANRSISASRFLIPASTQQSLSFDGVDDKLTLPFTPSIATGFSAGVWLYFDSPIATAKYPRIFDWWTSNNGMRTHFNGTLQKFELAIGYTSTSKSLYSSVIPYVGKWIHFAITYDPSTDTGKMYINGVLHSQRTDFTDGVDATGQTFTVAQPSDETLIIGEGEIAKIQMARMAVQNGVAWTVTQVLDLMYQNKMPSGAQEFLTLNGNVTDTSGNSNNGTLTGGTYSNNVPEFMKPRTAVANRLAVRDFGTCLQFNGTTSSIAVANHSSFNITSSFVISAWIRPVGFGGGGGGRIVDRNTGIQCFISSSSGQLVLANGASSVTSDSGVITIGRWQFIAAVYDDTNNLVTFYKNAVAVGTAVQATNPSSGSQIMYIGNRADGIRAFNGFMDNISLHTGAFTLQQIKDMYYAGIYPTTNLRNFWKFDEGSGATITDSAGSGATGSISNASYSTNVFMKARTAV